MNNTKFFIAEEPVSKVLIDFLSKRCLLSASVENNKMYIQVRVSKDGSYTWDQHDFEVSLNHE